jgi:hypothetical protein
MKTKQSKNETSSRKFAEFNVKLLTGSRRKQALSNRLEIKIQEGKTEFVQKLTLRQARALKNFLDQNLD